MKHNSEGVSLTCITIAISLVLIVFTSACNTPNMDATVSLADTAAGGDSIKSSKIRPISTWGNISPPDQP